MKKTVLITGGATGIGKACAYTFAKKGYSVGIAYNSSASEAASLKSELISNGSDAEIFCADISDYSEVKKMITDFIARFGKIDVLINNAAISQQKLFTDITPDEWQKMININLGGTFNVTHNAVPYMVREKSGRIINMSSMWGTTGASCEVHYSASKAAIIGFTKALAKELAPSGILVNCVAPGVIDTNMNSFLCENDKLSLCEEIPLRRFGSPKEVAQSILFLASDSASYITGQVICPNGGLVI